MKNKTYDNFLNFITRGKTPILLVFCLLLILANYFIIISLSHNHLSFTHLMYIPIVISGMTLGLYFGIGIALIAGFVVGPLMPYNLDTGVMQYWGDWTLRLVMMVSIGALSGVLAFNYQKAQQKIYALTYINPDSKLPNLSYLDTLHLEPKKTYTITTLMISNQMSICEVQSYQSYYAYLKFLHDQLLAHYKEIIVIQPEINKLWLIKPSDDFDLEVNTYLKIISESKYLNGQKLFIDYALGFSQKRHIHEKNLSNYFIESDLAAQEASKKNLTHMTYKDLQVNRHFEYEMLADFEEALSNGEIYLVYQPKISLKTKRPIGLEALIRWEHKTKKMIFPDQFIYAVEKTNMIHQMTQHVFNWSLDFQKVLNQNGISLPISINISTKNLYDSQFYDKMVDIFKSYSIKPHLVEFEITESLLMEDQENAKKMLDQLSNFGFKIAIDDFGKGYSSLAYLAQFPIHTIKIDRFFTRQILINPTTQHIVKATIDLAKQLGYEVLSEGVEDKETADLLEKLGCHTAQGYLYKRPCKNDEILTYLKKYVGQ